MEMSYKAFIINEIRDKLKNRRGVEDIIDALNDSDFFTTIASTNFFKKSEGLAEYCWRAYEVAKHFRDAIMVPVEDDSLVITCLLGQVGRAGMYESYQRNVKKEDPNTGKSHWETELDYRVIPAKDRELICGDIGTNSDRWIMRYTDLYDDEDSCLLNISKVGKENTTVDMDELKRRNKLLCITQYAFDYVMHNE